MIEATYTLTAEEFADAHRIAMRKINKKGRLVRVLLISIISIALIVVLATNRFHLEMSDAIRLIFPITLLTILLLSPWLQRRASRKTFEKLLKDQFTNFHVLIDDERYLGESPGTAKGEIYLTAFTDWLEGEKTIALIRLNAFYPIPKRVFTSAELIDLRKLLKTRVNQKL